MMRMVGRVACAAMVLWQGGGLRGVLGLLLLALAPATIAATASGRVFEDLNGNGLLDPGEPGLADVRVSDGLQVVTTDTDGRYRLRIDGDAVIFITKPRGFATPVDAHQLPQFYYIHQPDGSPDGMLYPGIVPTGALPASIDFPLIRRDEPGHFEAILLSDPQPQTDAELDYIRDDVVTELIGTSAAFGMTLGDILFDDLSMFPRYNALIATIGIPWYNVPGNHEMNFDAVDDRHSLETFKRYFGPPYYAFEYGEALFVVLDNIEYQGRGVSDPGDARGQGGYVANIGQRQLAWLKQELEHVARDRLIVLAMHAPLESYLGDAAGITTADRRALFGLLSGRPNIYAVAGHTHTTEHHYFDESDGFRGTGKFHHHILATVSGSWWSGPFDPRGIPTTDQRDGTPNGYHVLEVDGNTFTSRYQAAGKPADHQMRILFDVAYHSLRPDGMRDFRAGELFDGRFTVDQAYSATLLVNLFDGGPRSTVEFTIADRPYAPMKGVARADPYMLELYARNPDTKKSWLEATPSSHMFAARLPNDLAPGTHVVSVRAQDEFGRSHHGHSIIEITGR